MNGTKINYQCSNCGKHFESTPMCGIPHGMYYCGNRAVGDAFYCEECVKTWAERNGDEFDVQYPNSGHLFAQWWNKQVESQIDDKRRIRKYRELPNGDYVEV